MAELAVGPAGAAVPVGATRTVASAFPARHRRREEILYTKKGTVDFITNPPSDYYTQDAEWESLTRDHDVPLENESYERGQVYPAPSWSNPVNKFQQKMEVRLKGWTRKYNHSVRSLMNEEPTHSGSDTSSLCESSNSPAGTNLVIDDIDWADEPVATDSASRRPPDHSPRPAQMLNVISAPGAIKAECCNCGATQTPLWRRGLNDELNCNACGLYFKSHKQPRPRKLHTTGPAPVATPDVTPLECFNCQTTTTPLWRKDAEGRTVCNACGLFYSLHGSVRPISMKSDVIRKRRRKRKLDDEDGEGEQGDGGEAGAGERRVGWDDAPRVAAYPLSASVGPSASASVGPPAGAGPAPRASAPPSASTPPSPESGESPTSSASAAKQQMPTATRSAAPPVVEECSNCGATRTPLWRRGLDNELNCNACGIYCKLHKRPRPRSTRTEEPVRENPPEVTAECQNCHTTTTPLWRKDGEGKIVCNACGLFYNLHGSARPISMKSDVIRPRQRPRPHSAARRRGASSSVSVSAPPTPSPGHHHSGSQQLQQGENLRPLHPLVLLDHAAQMQAGGLYPQMHDA